MILTDREIQLALKKGQITVTPDPDLECFTSTSLDLRLGDRLNIFKKVGEASIETIIDPTKNYNAERAIKQLTDEIVIEDSGYVLHPGIFVLGRTKELVSLPEEARIAARVEGRSSLARLGLLIHFTAPTIHSGFNNSIRLEIINLGVVPIRLRRGMRICQLIFELTFGTPEKAFAPIQTS